VGAPATALQYVTAARPDGIVGGPDAAALANHVREALRARGDEGEPDGALAAVAGWIVDQRPDAVFSTREIALRNGFPGMTSASAAFRLDGEDRDAWRRSLKRVASNLPITRYAIHVSPDGIAVVIFGRMEVSLDPVPRRFRPGEACRLRGEVAARYDRAVVFLHRPDGKIDEIPIPGRKIDLSLPLHSPGVYMLEVMSAGVDPAVLTNVPIYVGVAEPALTSLPASDGASPASPAEFESRMLTLLNEARREARVPELASDSQLRAVAIGHTADMIAGGFFGHASPTTGEVDNRLKRAGVRVPFAGENIAQADTPEIAHRVLMDSPGHRTNMLFPKFTHVGIGVAASTNGTGDLVATLVFVRRRRPPSSPVTPALVTGFISSLRRARGLVPLSIDPVLQHAAEAGGATLAPEGASASEPAKAAAYTALVNESKRLRLARPAVCVELVKVLELDDLERDPIVLQPRPLKLGLATATKTIDDALTIFILVLAAGATCQ